MKRCLPLPILVVLLFGSLASGASPQRTETPVRLAEVLPVRSATPANARPQYVMTSETEILLDGRPCKFAQVPTSATIVQMEVSEDGRSILKVHFRSKR